MRNKRSFNRGASIKGPALCDWLDIYLDWSRWVHYMKGQTRVFVKRGLFRQYNHLSFFRINLWFFFQGIVIFYTVFPFVMWGMGKNTKYSSLFKVVWRPFCKTLKSQSSGLWIQFILMTNWKFKFGVPI